eukprot:sb/3476919/
MESQSPATETSYLHQEAGAEVPIDVIRRDMIAASGSAYQGDISTFESVAPTSLIRGMCYLLTGETRRYEERKFRALGDILMNHVIRISTSTPSTSTPASVSYKFFIYLLCSLR